MYVCVYMYVCIYIYIYIYSRRAHPRRAPRPHGPGGAARQPAARTLARESIEVRESTRVVSGDIPPKSVYPQKYEQSPPLNYPP